MCITLNIALLLWYREKKREGRTVSIWSQILWKTEMSLACYREECRMSVSNKGRHERRSVHYL